MARRLALSGVAVAALCASLCRADVDPDADPARPPRLRQELVQVSSSAAQAAYYDDQEGLYYITDSFLIAEANFDPPQLLGCSGGNAMGFSLDASSSIVAIEFSEMLSEVRLRY